MATRDDVAKLAGVSGATVTRVLTQSGFVSEKTREKVMDAVRQLDYFPHYSGQILRGQSTHQILFYCSELFNPFYVHVYYGMDDYAQKHGYNIVLSRHFDKKMLQQRRYDGVILSTTSQEIVQEQLNFIESVTMPAVAADFVFLSLPIPSVSIDMVQAGNIAARHLHEMGHRRLLYISDNSSSVESKWRGVEQYCKTQSVNIERMTTNPSPEMYDNLYELGHVYAEQIHRMIAPPTGVIAANDALATGLIGGLYALGLRVPEDVSVVGFDDTFLSRHTVPPLTTIHFPKYEMGYELMNSLHSIIENRPCENRKMETRLIVRQSTRKQI